MFEGFQTFDLDVEGILVHGVTGGSGPALLLLHGYPQTHVMWHKIAPQLAESFTVVAPDLRGYGDSSKPAGTEDHSNYSFRALAADQVSVMNQLGHDTFLLGGHDRGARVSHRMALDHPVVVQKLILMDIVPTLTVYETADQRISTGYYHWYFLIQPSDFPERIIGADPEYYLRRISGNLAQGGAFTDDAMAEYLRCFSKPETIHATCEDYRAAASIDLVHDQEDRDAGHKIQCPLQILWGAKGLMGKAYDVVETWREKCAHEPTGAAIPAGHFLAEESPEDTLNMMLSFLKS